MIDDETRRQELEILATVLSESDYAEIGNESGGDSSENVTETNDATSNETATT